MFLYILFVIINSINTLGQIVNISLSFQTPQREYNPSLPVTTSSFCLVGNPKESVIEQVGYQYFYNSLITDTGVWLSATSLDNILTPDEATVYDPNDVSSYPSPLNTAEGQSIADIDFVISSINGKIYYLEEIEENAFILFDHSADVTLVELTNMVGTYPQIIEPSNIKDLGITEGYLLGFVQSADTSTYCIEVELFCNLL